MERGWGEKLGLNTPIAKLDSFAPTATDCQRRVGVDAGDRFSTVGGFGRLPECG